MRTKDPQDEPTFRFAARWKEELVVTGPGGSFILELPMGELTACLPTQETWSRQAPEWAVDLWPTLKVELEAWCVAKRAAFVIDEKAEVWPFYGKMPVRDGRKAARGCMGFLGVLLLLLVFALWLLGQ